MRSSASRNSSRSTSLEPWRAGKTAAGAATVAAAGSASARRTALATGVGTSGRSAPSSGGGSVRRRNITAIAFSPVNGGRPASISNRTHPRAYTSARPSTGSLESCSGLM
jgi:hypothetical protein